jgi:hypothetical protein
MPRRAGSAGGLGGRPPTSTRPHQTLTPTTAVNLRRIALNRLCCTVWVLPRDARLALAIKRQQNLTIVRWI